MNGAGHKSTMLDAMAYVKAVKDAFQDNTKKFDEFMEVMNDHKARRIDIVAVLTRVRKIFEGRTDLIVGFNNFLPMGYEIPLPMEDEQPLQDKSNSVIENAFQFLKKVKARFQGNDHIYSSFLDIFKTYQKGDMGIHEVYHEVAALFEGHIDLLLNFTEFLPDPTFHYQTYSGDDDELTRIEAIAYVNAVKDMFQDNMEKFREFLEVMKNYHEDRIDVMDVTTSMKKILEGHIDLILGFNNFLPMGYEISLPIMEEEQTVQDNSNRTFENAQHFLNEVKARFQNKDYIYSSFLQIVNMFKKGDKAFIELYQEVSALFEGHTDLLLEFPKFLPSIY